MLALSPPLFSTNIGYWPLEEAIGAYEDQNYFYRGNTDTNYLEAANSLAQFTYLNTATALPPEQLVGADRNDRSASPSTATAMSSENVGMAVKKLNHNASERDRRKTVNQLYSSLRRLLPASDHKKKMSIPTTVSRVLKYIPDLQEEVEGLAQKRQELLSKINSTRQGSLKVKQELNCNDIKRTSRTISLSSVSGNQLNDREIALQISSYRLDKVPLSQMLHNLEEDGLFVLNASSFESLGGRVFHNLHLKVDGAYSLEYCGSLEEKLASLCDNREFVSMR